MKHTQVELNGIIRDLIMEDGLSAVLQAAFNALQHAASDAYRDYETTNLKSSLELAKAWTRDAQEVQGCRSRCGQPIR